MTRHARAFQLVGERPYSALVILRWPRLSGSDGWRVVGFFYGDGSMNWQYRELRLASPPHRGSAAHEMSTSALMVRTCQEGPEPLQFRCKKRPVRITGL